MNRLATTAPASDAPAVPPVQIGLTVQRVELTNFRNHRHKKVEDLGMLNILIGPNASGKTSIIEAIQLMTACSSFRTTHLADVVRHGQASCKVEALVAGNGRSLVQTMEVADGKRTYQVNGNPRSVGTMKGTLPAVVFCPDDLELVKGSNSTRLAALDYVASQLSASFRAVKRDYAQLQRQKNQALKDELADEVLDSIDTVLAKVSAQLTSHRQYVASRLSSALETRHGQLARDGEQASLVYRYSWDDATADAIMPSEPLDRTQLAQQMSIQLASRRTDERIRKRALVGAHADKALFVLDGQDATRFASQGQQRTLVLAFKLAELDVFKELGTQQPVLLLDDVMSELDQQRRERFMALVDDHVQTFVTTTNEEYFPPALLEKAHVIWLSREETLPNAQAVQA